MQQVFIGIITEGTTDERFLEKIVERTFIDIAYDCNNDIEPIVRVLHIDKSDSTFTEWVTKASKQGIIDIGMMVLCVHNDADDITAEDVLNNKFIPTQKFLDSEDDLTTCKNIVPIIPIRMIEAWMLADKSLLKEEIGTNLSDNQLGINRPPQAINDPKSVIKEAIRISRQNMPQRRRKDLQISDLYMPIGQKLSITKLQQLSSYQHFQKEVRKAYQKLHLLQ